MRLCCQSTNELKFGVQTKEAQNNYRQNIYRKKARYDGERVTKDEIAGQDR